MKPHVLLVLILVALTIAWALLPGTIPPGMPSAMFATSSTSAFQAVTLHQSSGATPTPSPDRPHELYLPLVLKKAWTVKLMVYPGPSNVDYGPGIELPQGTELTPLGRYVDFVKVQWTDTGGTLHEGFVWVSLLANLPASLPELSKDEVPWIENPIFVSTALC